MADEDIPKVEISEESGDDDSDDGTNSSTDEKQEKRKKPKELPFLQSDLEYTSLRSELLDAMKGEFRTFSLSITSSIIVLGYFFNHQPYNEFVLLIPIVVLTIAQAHIAASYFTVVHNAGYIRAVFEKDHKRWERWMMHLRHGETSSNEPVKRKNLIQRFFSKNHIKGIFVLDYHISVIFVTTACLFIGSGFACYTLHPENFHGMNWHRSFDPKVVSFVLSWLALFIWWIRDSATSFSKLRDVTASKYEDNYEKRLKDWLNKKSDSE